MILLPIILSYLIGSISFALLIGKKIYQVDLREHGSGNLGATNTLRVLGKKAGAIVLLGDIGKGILAASLPFILNSDINPIFTGLAAIIGHCYPMFSNFKGGKAVATTAGVTLIVMGHQFILSLITFLITLRLTKIVSLSSILAALALFITSFFTKDLLIICFSTCIFLFIVFKHRANIRRIINKTEPKINGSK